jgi:two-component system response regulator AtoC
MSAAPADAPTLPIWIAHAPESRRLLEMAGKVANTASTVLILGESGSGKDQLAQRLHFESPRRHQPVVKIDCASLPADLIESELFGYEKGAFTGAYQAKPGRLELAGEGTLVLDEIAALSLPLQAKLLRVIEEKSFERLGGHTSIRIAARLVALTNVDLEKAVARRSFREDLYYRLFVLPLQIPPLRARREDILPMAEHFLATLAAPGRPAVAMDAALRSALFEYDYPGNVRELRNVLSRALIWSQGNELGVADVPPYLAQAGGSHPADRTLEQVEKEHIAAVLQRCRGRKQQAAAVLGISAKTLLEKRRRYGLDLPWTDRLPEGTFTRTRRPKPAPEPDPQP